ncbi:hypothetical protein IWQ62_006227 [Dispira parvispora]|uniref:Uncharacterized protein n=1 Tax=Dispira parvispora TaxID=1520584 RepID=A0A9W8E3Y9_9FUNG|nr:hypothetical protein IWQ62_006227 [Dispira parvispora]
MQTKLLLVSAALMATQVCAVPRPQGNDDIFNQVANGIQQAGVLGDNGVNVDTVAQAIATNNDVAAAVTALAPQASLDQPIAAADTAAPVADVGATAVATGIPTDANVGDATDVINNNVGDTTDIIDDNASGTTDLAEDSASNTVETGSDTGIATSTDDVTESETGTDSNDIDTETDSSSTDSETSSATNTVSSRTTSQRTTTRPSSTDSEVPTEDDSGASFAAVSWLSVAVAAASLIGMRDVAF